MKLEKGLRDILDAFPGIQWAVEVGGKHHKLRVNGRLVLVLSKTPRDNARQTTNARAALRRHLRSITGG